jgi:hypothetical protein
LRIKRMVFDAPSEPVPIRSQRIPQRIETPVSFLTTPGAYVRYAYSRSADSMSSRTEGQDYLCFQYHDQRLVLVVCDGVGSSFCGNLAARLLGDGLLEWLWSVDMMYLSGAEALSEAAASALNRLQKSVKHEVEEYSIPSSIPALIKQALESQRAYGSEAVFVAARIDYPSLSIPEGLISLCWMGDSQIHALDEEGRALSPTDRWHNANRWSTVQGVRGHMSAWMRPLEGIGRVVAFTDGLSAHGVKVFGYGDGLLDREIRAGARLPSSDDVAFIDVVLRTPRYEGYPEGDIPDPNAERPLLEPIWNPTSAPIYSLKWSLPGQAHAGFMLQESTNAALTDARMIEISAKQIEWQPPKPQPPGHYYYRVRAINRHGTLTPWSELRQIVVAHPPPPAPSLTVQNERELLWESEEDSLDYELEQSSTAAFDQPEVVYTGRGTGWSLPINMPPGEYVFRVRGLSDGGTGAWSASQTLKITLPPPARPQLALLGSPDGSHFELRWQAVHSAEYYELEIAEAGKDTPQLIRIEETRYPLDAPEPADYVFRLRACHLHGCSEWSNEQDLIIEPPPARSAPELRASQSSASAPHELEWTESEGCAYYEVQEAPEPDFKPEGVRIHRVFHPSHRLTLPARPAGTYHYRVQAIGDDNQSSAWSNTLVRVIPPPETQP